MKLKHRRSTSLPIMRGRDLSAVGRDARQVLAGVA